MSQLYTPARITTSAPQVQDITTGAVSEPVSLQELKESLSIFHNQQDVMLAGKIISVRQLIEDYCRVSLIPKTLRFYYEQFGCKVRLPHGPHTDSSGDISISNVIIIDREGTETELALNTDYYIKGLNFVMLHFSANVLTTGGYPNSLQLEAEVGYTTSTLPQVFKDAIIKQIAWDYDGNRGEIETNYRKVLTPEVMSMIARERKVINL